MTYKTARGSPSSPTQREAGNAFRKSGAAKPVTEYDKAQEAFRKNYERLKAERLAREAAKSEDK